MAELFAEAIQGFPLRFLFQQLCAKTCGAHAAADGFETVHLADGEFAITVLDGSQREFERVHALMQDAPSELDVKIDAAHGVLQSCFGVELGRLLEGFVKEHLLPRYGMDL